MERLQKILSAAGLASRRGAEQLIREGRVTVNGKVASVGESADLRTDTVCLDGEAVCVSQRRHYVLLHKPRGYITTVTDPYGRPTVMELVKIPGVRLYPVGRLDMDSEGLLLLTDDGDFANRLMHPAHEINKVYTVFVTGNDLHNGIQKLSALTQLDGEPIAKPSVTLIELNGGKAELQVVIHEGKNRQVRRMCESCGMNVTRLIRIAEGPLVLEESMEPGAWRYLSKSEVAQCLS